MKILVSEVTLALAVKDFDASRSFYEGLGFLLELDEWIGSGLIPRPFRRLRMSISGSAVFLEFLPECLGSADVPLLTLTLSVEDVYRTEEYVRKFSGTSRFTADELPTGRVFTFADPGGNLIQICSLA